MTRKLIRNRGAADLIIAIGVSAICLLYVISLYQSASYTERKELQLIQGMHFFYETEAQGRALLYSTLGLNLDLPPPTSEFKAKAKFNWLQLWEAEAWADSPDRGGQTNVRVDSTEPSRPAVQSKHSGAAFKDVPTSGGVLKEYCGNVSFHGSAPDRTLCLVHLNPNLSLAFTVNGSITDITVPTGSNVTLVWSSTNATACSVTPGSFTGISGTQVVTPPNAVTTSYTLSCTNPSGGSATKTLAVTVSPIDCNAPSAVVDPLAKINVYPYRLDTLLYINNVPDSRSSCCQRLTTYRSQYPRGQVPAIGNCCQNSDLNTLNNFYDNVNDDADSARKLCNFSGWKTARVVETFRYSSCNDNRNTLWDTTLKNWKTIPACNDRVIVSRIECTGKLRPECISDKSWIYNSP